MPIPEEGLHGPLHLLTRRIEESLISNPPTEGSRNTSASELTSPSGPTRFDMRASSKAAEPIRRPQREPIQRKQSLKAIGQAHSRSARPLVAVAATLEGGSDPSPPPSHHRMKFR